MASPFMCLPGYLAQPTEKDYEYTYYFEKEYALLKKEITNDNYAILFSWAPSHLRFKLLETHCKHPNIQLKDFKVWEQVYVYAEEHYRELITLLPYFIENRPKLRHKKPIIRVYRGVNNHNAGLTGYSWTTNREVAEGFALRHYKTRGEDLRNFPDALVYVGEVSLQHVLAEIYAGGECELLIQPSHVEITKCIPATDFKYREQVENRRFLF